MPQPTDFPAHGKVTEVNSGTLIFAPTNTNYLLNLQTATPYTGPLNQPISALIRVKARKLYTVPSGGGFVAPIFGPPRTIEGRAVFVDDSSLVIRAGLPIIVEIPSADTAIDLSSGPIAVGSLVNAVAFPGGTFELAPCARALVTLDKSKGFCGYPAPERKTSPDYRTTGRPVAIPAQGLSQHSDNPF